jgi:hypothetical protein
MSAVRDNAVVKVVQHSCDLRQMLLRLPSRDIVYLGMLS